MEALLLLSLALKIGYTVVKFCRSRESSHYIISMHPIHFDVKRLIVNRCCDDGEYEIL